MRGRKPNEALRAEVSRLRAAGLTQREIGQKIGRHQKTICEMLQRINGGQFVQLDEPFPRSWADNVCKHAFRKVLGADPFRDHPTDEVYD